MYPAWQQTIHIQYLADKKERKTTHKIRNTDFPPKSHETETYKPNKIRNTDFPPRSHETETYKLN